MMLKRLFALVAVMVTMSVYADGTRDDVEGVYKYRLETDFQIKLMKGLKLNVGPELRFYEGFDRLLLNAGLTYKRFGCVYFGAAYRMVVERYGEGYNETATGDYEYQKGPNIYHRYAFDVTYKERYHRFTPSFRFRYNNYTEDDLENKNYLRYRAKVDYDIKKCRLTPAVFVEAFQNLDLGKLYKMRYAAELDYKIGKHASMALSYMEDFFCLEYKNAHIFSLGYKQRF